VSGVVRQLRHPIVIFVVAALDKVMAEFTTWPLTWENGSGLVLW